jgi:tripartite-type tricarboxylate transporter receptor subunit TctC
MIAAWRRKAADMMMPLIVLLTFVFGMNAELASAQIPFYQDKTITVVLGGPPAGSADLRTRAVISLLRKSLLS